MRELTTAEISETDEIIAGAFLGNVINLGFKLYQHFAARTLGQFITSRAGFAGAVYGAAKSINTPSYRDQRGNPIPGVIGF